MAEPEIAKGSVISIMRDGQWVELGEVSASKREGDMLNIEFDTGGVPYTITYSGGDMDDFKTEWSDPIPLNNRHERRRLGSSKKTPPPPRGK